MAKRKKGVLDALWGIFTFSASAVIRFILFIAKSAYRLVAWLAGKLFAAAKKRAEGAKKPKSEAACSPLEPQKSQSGSLESFEEKLYSPQSSIGLILGARGSGKSALGMRLLENVHAKAGRKVCAMGFDSPTLPEWIKPVQSADEAPNGSFLLVDEGGIAFSSRSSQSSANKLLSSLMLVARHKDLSILFISQNSANLEVNAIRQADFLLLRKASLLQKEFERKKIGEIYSKAEAGFSSLPNNGKHSTYIFSDEFTGFAANSLPSFWSQKTSKAYASYSAKKEKK